MGLPIPLAPTYTTILPISKKEIKYRGFLVGEEKLAILALTDVDEDNRNIAFMRATVDIAQRCILTPDMSILEMETADFEHFFIKLRMVSKDNKVELEAPCSKCSTTTRIQFDLHDVRVTDSVDSRIKLTPSIGIQLNGPTVQNVINSMTNDKKVSKRKMLYDSVKCVWQDEEIYTDFTVAEFDTWLDALNQTMMQKINTFFDNLPAIVADIKFVCKDDNCAHENEQAIKGIPRFFV